MSIEKETILQLLQDFLKENPIDFYNEFTTTESRITRKTIFKIIELVNERL